MRRRTFGGANETPRTNYAISYMIGCTYTLTHTSAKSIEFVPWPCLVPASKGRQIHRSIVYNEMKSIAFRQALKYLIFLGIEYSDA